VNKVISTLNFEVLLGGKYLLKKALERASHVPKEFGSSCCSQLLALSFNEKMKGLSSIAYGDTPLSLMVSHFKRKL